jgi:hypothetical protein
MRYNNDPTMEDIKDPAAQPEEAAAPAAEAEEKPQGEAPAEEAASQPEAEPGTGALAPEEKTEPGSEEKPEDGEAAQ